MKRFLLISALVIVLGAVATWLATGANRGWTKTSQVIKTTDPVTGIDGITYQPKFLPGVDFLGAAGAISGTLAVTSLLFRKPKTTKNQ